MASRDLPHFFLPPSGRPERFTPKGGGGGTKEEFPDVDRHEHSSRLRRQLAQGLSAFDRLSERAEKLTGRPKTGLHLTFESFEGIPLKLESLENRQFSVPSELVAVRQFPGDHGPKEVATVWMPPEVAPSLDRKLEAFATGETVKGAPKNQPLVQAMATIGTARLEALWTEPTKPFPPEDEERWWEIWLVKRDGDEPDLLRAAMTHIQATVAPGLLEFPDRSVMKIRTTAKRLASVVLLLDGVAELRDVSAGPDFFRGLPAGEESKWVQDLLDRATFSNGKYTPAACILDTGLRKHHELIAPSLLPGGLHAYDPSWGVEDDEGHGTEMAGIALFEDSLADALADSEQLVIPIGIESVKILPPPPGTNPKPLWGTITASAVALAEQAAPHRRRAFTMAVTAPQPAQIPPAYEERAESEGIPTSWSASIDATAAGQAIDVSAEGITALSTRDPQASRLFVISAGNVRRPWQKNYEQRCALEGIEDPAQAWNAITVGAYTNRVDPSPFDECRPLAPRGGLSPHSRTSQVFDRAWPIKPDVVFEGGNLAVDDNGHVVDPEGMMLLTTEGRPRQWHPRNLVPTSGTSPATAIAGGFAARIWAENPKLWPETVRALISHSARWTQPMDERIYECHTLGERDPLLRSFGMGVPSLERALRSATDEVTLVAEEVIQPFQHGKHREMRLHELPWPAEALRDLGALDVRMRVTLSYFISPNPSRRGWKGRYVYPSHGLRFDVKRPLESVEHFRARVNKLADDGTSPTIGESGNWTLGPKLRRRGSLLTDIWTGTAAELADRGAVAVFPSAGWWKTRKVDGESERGARYALVVSIEAPEADVDLWTAVSNAVKIDSPVEIGS